MFCRKCGVKILDDSVFCPKCGTKVETITNVPQIGNDFDNDTKYDTVEENKTSIESNPEVNINSEEPENNTTIEHPLNNTKTNKIVFWSIAAVILLVIIIISIIGSTNCKNKGCSNKKVDGADYCYSHICDYTGCTSGKGYGSDYCYTHRCSYSLCDNGVVTDGEYCYSHTCATSGCLNQVSSNSPNCSQHKIDMRTRLGKPSMGFSLNSAGGIEFDFSASNNSGKTIKYVRFNAYLKNSVGDSIQEEISNKYYADVEIIGPINSGGTVRMYDEIIGYCDNLARIDIKNITIVYSDGTSETGSYNYYCDD